MLKSTCLRMRGLRLADSAQPFQPTAPASREALAALRADPAKSLPEGYMAFLERTNGGAGFIGERYVHLWRAEDLVEVNRAYKIAEFFLHFFLFGSDGGGEAYGCEASE